MKTLNLNYSDEDFEYLKDIKNKSGLSWEKFFIQVVKDEEYWADVEEKNAKESKKYQGD